METVGISDEMKRGRNRLATAVILGRAVKHIYNSGLQSVILISMRRDMELSGSAFGLLSPLQVAASCATTMAAGYLGDRFANKSGLILAASLGVMGVSFFLLGQAGNYALILAAILLIGMGTSLYDAPATASLSRKFPNKRGFIVSLHETGGIAGGVAGPFLTGALIYETPLIDLGWRDVLTVSLFPALFFAVVIYLTMRNMPTSDADATSLHAYFSSLGELLRRPAIISLVCATALVSVGQWAVGMFIPFYLLADLEYTSREVGLFVLGAQVMSIFTQPVIGYMSDKFGRKVVLVPCVAALGALIIALRFAPQGAPLTVTVLAMGLATGAFPIRAICIAGAMDVARGQAQSTAASLIYGASFLGAFSLWGGAGRWLIFDWTQTANAFIFSGAMVIIAAIVLVLTRLPKTAN